jgi:hypothetical protein
MSSSKAGPLASLIGRHSAGRTDAQLADACGGVISPARWHELKRQPSGQRPSLPPSDVDAVALALSLTAGTVRHYMLANGGLPAALTH